MSNTESFLEYYEVIKSVIKPGFIGFDYSDRIWSSNNTKRMIDSLFLN